MTTTSDVRTAKRMLEARATGYTLSFFLKHHAKMYAFRALITTAILLIAINTGRNEIAIAFGAFVLGLTLRDFDWFRAHRKVHPIGMRLTNWPLVEAIAKGEQPPASMELYDGPWEDPAAKPNRILSVRNIILGLIIGVLLTWWYQSTFVKPDLSFTVTTESGTPVPDANLTLWKISYLRHANSNKEGHARMAPPFRWNENDRIQVQVRKDGRTIYHEYMDQTDTQTLPIVVPDEEYPVSPKQP